MTTTPDPDRNRDNPFRGTTSQQPGVYPFPLGAARRPVGVLVPTGESVEFDPTVWVRGIAGFGKSTLAARLKQLDAERGAAAADGERPHDLDALGDTGRDGERGQL